MKVNSIGSDLQYVQSQKVSDGEKKTSKTADRLELSEEAKKLDTSILQKIKSGFYNSDEVRKVLVEKIIKEI